MSARNYRRTIRRPLNFHNPFYTTGWTNEFEPFKAVMPQSNASRADEQAMIEKQKRVSQAEHAGIKYFEQAGIPESEARAAVKISGLSSFLDSSSPLSKTGNVINDAIRYIRLQNAGILSGKMKELEKFAYYDELRRKEIAKQKVIQWIAENWELAQVPAEIRPEIEDYMKKHPIRQKVTQQSSPSAMDYNARIEELRRIDPIRFEGVIALLEDLRDGKGRNLEEPEKVSESNIRTEPASFAPDATKLTPEEERQKILYEREKYVRQLEEKGVSHDIAQKAAEQAYPDTATPVNLNGSSKNDDSSDITSSTTGVGVKAPGTTIFVEPAHTNPTAETNEEQGATLSDTGVLKQPMPSDNPTSVASQYGDIQQAMDENMIGEVDHAVKPDETEKDENVEKQQKKLNNTLTTTGTPQAAKPPTSSAQPSVGVDLSKTGIGVEPAKVNPPPKDPARKNPDNTPGTEKKPSIPVAPVSKGKSSNGQSTGQSTGPKRPPPPPKHEHSATTSSSSSSSSAIAIHPFDTKAADFSPANPENIKTKLKEWEQQLKDLETAVQVKVKPAELEQAYLQVFKNWAKLHAMNYPTTNKSFVTKGIPAFTQKEVKGLRDRLNAIREKVYPMEDRESRHKTESLREAFNQEFMNAYRGVQATYKLKATPNDSDYKTFRGFGRNDSDDDDEYNRRYELLRKRTRFC